MQIVCGYCEESFETNRTDQLYCNRTCQDRHLLSKRRYGGLHFQVLKRDDFKCQKCSAEDDQLHVHHIDEDVKHNEMSNLITLCQKCHKGIHHSGSRNNHYKSVSKTQIENAIAATSTLDEAANLLGITRSTLRKKRFEYGMDKLTASRKGEESKQYVHLKLSEIEMAYELEGTWVKAAERLGISEGFLRKRYKELRGLESTTNRIYKGLSKEEILEVYQQTGSWKETASLLGISVKGLLYNRKKFGLI